MGMLNLWREELPGPFLTGWEDFQRDVERLMRYPTLLADREQRGFMNPAVDVDETKEGYVFAFDLPGLKKDDINIEITGDRLEISGERRREQETKEKNFLRSERQVGKFRRTFSLPDGVDPDKVSANYHDGVLTLEIAKAAKAKPRRIQVGEDTPKVARIASK